MQPFFTLFSYLIKIFTSIIWSWNCISRNHFALTKQYYQTSLINQFWHHSTKVSLIFFLSTDHDISETSSKWMLLTLSVALPPFAATPDSSLATKSRYPHQMTHYSIVTLTTVMPRLRRASLHRAWTAIRRRASLRWRGCFSECFLHTFLQIYKNKYIIIWRI